MQIPDYFIKALRTRLRRISDNARCDPSDTRTVNALRLVKGDLRKLDKIIAENEYRK